MIEVEVFENNSIDDKLPLCFVIFSFSSHKHPQLMIVTIARGFTIVNSSDESVRIKCPNIVVMIRTKAKKQFRVII